MGLGGEPRAALGSPRLQDRSTRPGLHPGAEAVLALAAPVVGLVRPLGHLGLFRSSGPLDPAGIEIAKSSGLFDVRRSIAEPRFSRQSRASRALFPSSTNPLDAPWQRLATMPPVRNTLQDRGQGSRHFPVLYRRSALTTTSCPQVWIKLWTGAKCLLRPAFPAISANTAGGAPALVLGPGT